MKHTLAGTMMMSCLAALVACGPEMAIDAEAPVMAEEPENGLQTAREPLKAVGLSDVSCTTTYSLTNGAPTSGLSAGAQVWSCIYTLYVPSGATNLKFETSGGTGDADLFVKFGSTPTSTSYDCKSSASGNTETCNISTAQTGTYYVRLYGYSAAAGVTLTGSYTPAPPPPVICNSTISLSNGYPRAGVTASAGYGSCIYTLVVPSGATNLKFETTGGTGDADLFVKFGSTPTSTSYDCKSSSTTSVESCAIATPQAGTYYVRMFGYSDSSNITLTGSYTAAPPPPSSCSYTENLSNGTAKTGISIAAGYWSCVYALYVPPGATTVRFSTTGATGDVDLFVKLGASPTDSSYDCRSASISSSETCTVSAPQSGTYYVRLYGYSASSGVSLTGVYN